MLRLPIRSVVEPRKLVVAAPDATVYEAARLMKKGKVGALLVVAEGRLVGIFTERDVLFRVTAAGRDPGMTRLSSVMTRNPQTVAPDDTFGRALLLMHDKGLRHVPVVEGGRPVGMISARNALDLLRFAPATPQARARPSGRRSSEWACPRSRRPCRCRCPPRARDAAVQPIEEENEGRHSGGRVEVRQGPAGWSRFFGAMMHWC
jgi:CBS domain-containing protein